MRGRGRPVKYDPSMCYTVEKLCLLGCTNAQIAEFLEINEDTLNRWMHKYYELYVTIKSSKLLADGAVAQSLFKKALSGDTVAAIFWLKNRNRLLWDNNRRDTDNEGRQAVPNLIFVTPPPLQAPNTTVNVEPTKQTSLSNKPQ